MNILDTKFQCSLKREMTDKTIIQEGQLSLEMRKGYYAANITSGREIGLYNTLRKTFRK